MAAAPTQSIASRLSLELVLAAVMALVLIAYGMLRFPATSLLSVSTAACILAIYAVLGWLLANRIAQHNRALVAVAQRAGLLAGIVFAGEILLEYLLLPADNTLFGLVEFGLVFLIYAGASGWLTARGNRLRAGVLGAVATAMISSLIWCIALFVVFYLFTGTARQVAVFRAEGNYDDFQRSGMGDFNAFIMEDFLGATFFHLLLGPLLAAALGAIGGLIGMVLGRLRRF